jgi:hypothetical protein
MVGLIWAIIVILAVIWFIGFVLVHLASPLIHLLLLIAVILLIWNLVAGPRTTV